MKRNQILSRLASLSLVLIMFTSLVQAQGRTITGTVTDEAGEAIIGVTVLVAGTTIGTITDIQGAYSLEVPEDAVYLMYSFVGMSTQQVEIGDQTVIDITMAEDVIGLDEVVVIGYGTAKKEDLTGAIVNVQAEEFMKYQPKNVTELLRSSVPGLHVTYSTSAKNVPDFEIRGDNTIKASDSDERSANRPLIVLDGVIFNGDIAEINVNDIESVDVLKDASAAAIYGSRASNGVVVFTTKKGRVGKPVFRLSTKMGIVTKGRHLESFKGGDEVMTWLTDMNESINDLTQEPWTVYDKFEDVPAANQSDWLAANGIPGETDPTVITSTWLDNFGFEQNEKENYLAGIVYDWEDFLFHTGLRQDYNLSVTGATERVSYYWSLGYQDSESVNWGEKWKQINSRLNLDVSATDWLNVGLNMSFARQDEGQEFPGNGGYYTASPYDMPWQNNVPRTKENLKTAGAGSNRSNPYLNPAYRTRLYDRYRVFPTLYGKLTLPLGLTFTSRFTTRFDFRKRFWFEEGAHPRQGHGGNARRRHNQTFEWQTDNILNWDKEFGQHRFAVTGLANAEKNQSWFTEARGTQFSPTDALGYSGLAFSLSPSINSDDQVVTRTALMGRVNYAFANRYHLSASMRRDGYSRFGSANVYGTFPSVSAAWTISSESFSLPGWLTFLKVRASWGINGNSSGLGSYAAFARMRDRKFLQYDNGYQTSPYLYINRIANPALSWEKNAALNFGLDYGLWDGRVRGGLDVYSSTTTDLLLDKKLPSLTGFDDITTNVGELQNLGFDLSINTINVQTNDLLFTSSLLIHFNKNKIVSLTGELVPVIDSDGNPVLDASGNPVLEEPDDLTNGWFIGESKDVIWDYEVDGVYKIGEEAEAAVYGLYPGDFRVVDQNDDGVLNIEDKVFQGLKSNPWYITFRNEVQWRNFDLGVIMLAKLGWYGGNHWPFNERQEYIKNHNWYNLPYWTPNNQIDDAARINSIRLTDMNIWVPRNYLRIQNIALGYNLPDNLVAPLNISNARIAFNVDNAAVFTKWVMGDPEDTSSSRDAWLEMMRTYTFSLDISF